MNDDIGTRAADPDTEFDQWLATSNTELIDSTAHALDIDVMLRSAKRRGALIQRTERRAARPTVASIGNVVGTLALQLVGKPPADAERRDRKQVFRLQSRYEQDEGSVDASLSAAVNGDPQAVSRILTSIRPLVVRYCRARVGRHGQTFASADDVAQEVCLAVLTALPGYRDQGRPFLAFVYGIAAHKVADAHRAAMRDRQEPVADVPDVPDLASGPEQRAMQAELSDRMRQLLDVLPPKQREIVVLRVVVGLSAEETAEAVGSTPGAVRVAQHRALARLRKTLSADVSP